MKKILLTGIMVVALGACSSTENMDTEKLSRETNKNTGWWQDAGETHSDNWWITEYEEDDSK